MIRTEETFIIIMNYRLLLQLIHSGNPSRLSLAAVNGLGACHENENEHDFCTLSVVFCTHLARRCLGRGGSLLIDRFYCLLLTSIVRKVDYGWKSRAYD